MVLRMGLRLAVAALAVLPLVKFASAQTVAAPSPPPTKLAVVNLQQAVLGTAEIKKANTEMQAKYKPRTDQLEQLQKDLAGISQQLQNNSGKLTPQAEADLQADGQRKQRDAQRLQEDLQNDVDAERNQILTNATKKMQEVVKKIADEKGYDLVIDVTTAVFYRGTLDITSDAIAAYDKTYPPK